MTSRFGIGLFAYQSLDAIDGCVGPSYARLGTRVLEPLPLTSSRLWDT